MTHVIVCGGRHEYLTPARVRWLDHLRRTMAITTVYHGSASGIDTDAGIWAAQWDACVVAMPADWSRYGTAAGPIRNTQMLRALQRQCGDEPMAVIVFPGGRGTADMRQKAVAAGLVVLDAAQEMEGMATIVAPSVALSSDHFTELRVVLDQMQVRPYNDPPTKLEKAYKAVLEERITVLDGSQMIFSVASAMRPEVSYRVHEGTCQCPYARAHPTEQFSCAHAVAARLYQRWQHSPSPLSLSQKESPMPRSPSGPASAPLLTPDVVLASESPHVPQEAPEATPDDIPEHPVPPAVLEAVTGAREPSKILPPDFGVHEALLQGFCQYLQGKMHTWMMEEHRTLTAGMDTTMAGMRDYAKSVLDGNEHAQYQLSDALGKLCESGLPVRQDPYVMHVAARSPEGFAVTIDVSKASVTELVEALPALLAWLRHSQFTPGVSGGRDA